MKNTNKNSYPLAAKIPRLAGWVLMGSGLLSNTVYAIDYTVTTATDTDCTVDFICDLQSALTDAAGNGSDDTITMQAGVYTISALDTPFRFNPTDGARLDLLSLNVDDVIITRANPSDPNTQSQLLNINVAVGAASSISVSNITFQAGRNTTGNGGGLYFSSVGTDITLNNNIFTRNYAELGFGGGLFVDTVSGDIELNNNVIKNNFPLPVGIPPEPIPLANMLGAGAYLKSNTGNITLVNNIIVNNRTEIIVDPATILPVIPPDPDVPDEPLYDTYGGGVYIESTNAGNIILTNNTIMQNVSALGGAGVHIQVNNDISNTSIYNNIIWGNMNRWTLVSAEIRVENDGDNNTIGAIVKLFNNNYSVAEIVPGGQNFTEENNIFVNPSLSAEYIPLAGCFCIDSGSVEAPRLPIYDFYGLSRTLGTLSIPDMGVAEYTPSKFSSENCFIATAAYGSFMHDDVKLLRQFRDAYLVNNAAGQWFVGMYYQYSPPIANVIRQHEWLRGVTRWLLAPLVMVIKFPLLMLGLVILGALGWRVFNHRLRGVRKVSMTG